MDVAENVGNAGTVEKYVPRRAGFVKTEVETFSFEERENVVKKRISVGKFDHRSHWHNQEPRLKAFVVLCQSEATRGLNNGSGGSSLCAWHIGKPNNCLRSVLYSG